MYIDCHEQSNSAGRIARAYTSSSSLHGLPHPGEPEPRAPGQEVGFHDPA